MKSVLCRNKEQRDKHQSGHTAPRKVDQNHQNMTTSKAPYTSDNHGDPGPSDPTWPSFLDHRWRGSG